MKIPEVYPEDLDECLMLFEKFTYKSHGFPVIWLLYNFHFKYWTMVFRNPVNFKDPGIKAETPKEACYAMLDFLKTMEE